MQGESNQTQKEEQLHEERLYDGWTAPEAGPFVENEGTGKGTGQLFNYFIEISRIN